MPGRETLPNGKTKYSVSFFSASYNFKKKLVGIILSGANKDGALGLKSVTDNGGLTIVQDPKECQVPTMTTASMNATKVDYVFSTKQIIDFLLKLA